MFGLGPFETMLIFLVLFLLFGPSQIPKMARGLGQALREFQKAKREISDEMNREETARQNPPPNPPDNKPVN